MSFHDEYEARCTNTRSDIHAHLPTLYRYASAGDCQIIELGVRNGDSTSAFLAAITEHGGHLWSCDVVASRFVDDWQVQADGQWEFVHGDDVWAADRAPSGVDIVFIDTSHAYEHTKTELTLYAPKLRPGGVVLLHDTELKSPADSPATDPPYPVLVAAEGFADEHSWELELIPGCYGLGVLHSPEVNDG